MSCMETPRSNSARHIHLRRQVPDLQQEQILQRSDKTATTPASSKQLRLVVFSKGLTMSRFGRIVFIAGWLANPLWVAAEPAKKPERPAALPVTAPDVELTP